MTMVERSMKEWDTAKNYQDAPIFWKTGNIYLLMLVQVQKNYIKDNQHTIS